MVNLMGHSVLVDNEEQARKLQEIAFEQGFEWANGGKIFKHINERSFQFGYDGEMQIVWTYDRKHYQDIYITKKAHFNDLFNSLEQQLEKAKAEVERLEKEIENNKIKAGDWVINPLTNIVIKVTSLKTKCPDHYKKITNPQLIELLENEIK